MMRYIKLSLALLVCISFLFGCAAQAENQGSGDTDYENTKKMMIDLLKSDDGKSAMREILKDEKLRENLIIDEPTVKKTIETTLTSEKGKAFWQEIMKDPEFTKTFAESMQKENEKLLKGLMKDPEYQTMMMDVMKDPEMEKAILELLKSKEYRQQVMTVMTEAFESPHFKAKISEVLGKVAEEQMSKEEKGGSESGGNQEGGGS
ncbi:spore germination lipoprotein GerD [Alteribacillus iranensis]|uniref:Spore germination protein D n=1 Tax=Alteribacillus iranensis TaxID=930128 RepID=A0A1I2F4C0_9BACI|nr:spore germination lipoprotein GerD [Alteribacillus iranensis]SFF00182.1 spore germination protein D [Alteribacillus iranensis]